MNLDRDIGLGGVIKGVSGLYLLANPRAICEPKKTTMVRHSHEDALTEASYHEFVATAKELPEPFDAQCHALLVLAGRLGMRAGEITHIRQSWINREKEVIDIPRYSDCQTGRSGGVCGYCKKRAREAAEHNDITYEEALADRWNPKTAKGARAVPYDFNDEIAAVVEAFFDDYDCWPTSRVGVNRRVDRIAEAAGYSDRIYPHALRATAATWHASRGLAPAALQSLMGWAQLSVANKYVRLTGAAVSRALKEAHGD